MSVIQQIQEKYAKVMAVIIALALVIFVVMLAFENGGGLFRGDNANTVGSVNGKNIEFGDFQNKIKATEANMEAQGYQPEMAAAQAPEQAWTNEVYRALIFSEIDKLGLGIGKKETGDILYGPNAPDQIKQAFTDEQGVFNAQAAKQQIDKMLKTAKPEVKQQFLDQLQSFKDSRLNDKFNSLLVNTVNVPKWIIEKENADNSLLAKVSLVRELYTTPSIPDSTIKITDEEINSYIEKNKKDPRYKQVESRSISFVAFSANPTSADTLEVRKELTDLKAGFDTTDNAAGYVASNASSISYSDTYVGKSFMQMPNKDTIQRLPINAVYGPYLDNSAWAMAKMVDIKQLPDSVQCRHILLGTNIPDSIAKITIDSIATAIRGGANFDSLEAKYTTDQGAHATKGVMTFASTTIQMENFAPEFGKFILFDGRPGDKKVVKTQYGQHYIEIMKFINEEPHYKVAYLAKPIEASKTTQNKAFADASKFAADSRDAKSFDANAGKLEGLGITKTFASDITPTASNIPGIGTSRAFVKNIYEADLGDVIGPESIEGNYIVALITEDNKEGLKSAAKARMMVEPVLRTRKKAELLAKKVGNVTTLEAAATALGGKPIEVVDSIRLSGGQTSYLAGEPMVLGAAFNPANKGKVVPSVLQGNSGIYVVRVDNVGTTPLGDANVVAQRTMRIAQAKQNPSLNPFEALRSEAKIKDNRRKLF